MRWQGTIDFAKPILLNGRHHGVEILSTLPIHQPTDEGRVVYAEDTETLYVGASDQWKELTPAPMPTHDHNDLYYTQLQLQTSGESSVHYGNITNVPSFALTTDINYTNLNANGSVGTGATQVAQGDHTHSEYDQSMPVTKVLYVDGNRSDTYTEEGTIYHPYKTIQDALDVSSSGDTVIVMAGTYTEDIVVPVGVSLVSYSQVKVSIQGDATFNGPGTPITIQGMIFTGNEKTLTVNCTAHLFESYSYSRVVFGPTAHIQANVFNVNVNQSDVDAITFNGSGDCNLIASSVRAKGDAHAIVVNSGRLAFFNGEASSEEATKATLKCNGGNVILSSSQVTNTAGSISVDLSDSDGSPTSPNGLSGVIAVGNIMSGTKTTIIDGVQFIMAGSLSGSNLLIPQNIMPLTNGDPSDEPVTGTTRFDSGTNTLYVYNGTDWVSTVLT